MANQTVESSGKVERLRYFKGQLLTADDFKAEQTYHRDRVTNLLRRFPYGIIDGLNVVPKTKTEADPESFDGFLIEEGLAVDEDGNQIVVPAEGIRILRENVLPERANNPYLSLVYFEELLCVGTLCDSAQKNNRIHEAVGISWVSAPNIRNNEDRPTITVAYIEKTDEDTLILKTDISPDGKLIRIDARVIDEENIKDGAVSESKIASNAVTESKIAADAITDMKIRNNAVRDRHIAPNAVREDKIANDAIISRHIKDFNTGTLDFNYGIKESHIQNDAIISRHIKAYDPQDPNNNHGIKASHIQNNAIESRHIKEFDPTNPDDDHGIKTGHIQNNAIIARHILSNAIITRHIQDGNVSIAKLDVLDDQGTVTGTFGTAGDPPPDPDPIMEDDPVVIFDGANFDEVRFPHVLPLTSGTRLVWSFEIERMSGDRMAYHFHISKNTPGVVSYKIQFVRFTGSD